MVVVVVVVVVVSSSSSSSMLLPQPFMTRGSKREGRRFCGLSCVVSPFSFCTVSQRYSRLGKEKLGSVSYGYVYPAWDTDSSRVVAVKVQKRPSEEAAREMMLFQSIPAHPNLLKLLDACVEEPNLLLVLEHMYNSLSDVFHRAQGLLDMDVARNYAQSGLAGPQPLTYPQFV
jgi:hypothetical protein